MNLPSNFAPAAIAFAAVALAVLSLAMLWEWWSDRRRTRDIARRLGSMAEGGEGTSTKSRDPFGDLLRPDDAARITWLEPVIARLPHVQDLQTLLEQGRIRFGLASFVLYTVGGALAMGLATWVFTGLGIAALGAATLGATFPYLYVKRQKTRRLRQFEEHFPEAIDLLGRAIRSGHAFSTGLGMVAEESPDPVGQEFRQVFEEQKFGLAMEDSMLALADRIDLLDMRIFVTALLIQREVGGNLAEILDKIAHTIRERFTIQRQVRVYTAQGRFTGYLLGCLPIIVGALIFGLNTEYMSILFHEPAGRFMIAVAVTLQIFGFLVIRRIIDIDI